MVITYYGLQCFKVQFGDTIIALDPISKKSSAKAPRFGADICLISVDHPDFNGVEQVSRGGNDSFVIELPGEYEVKDVYIKGFLTTTSYGGRPKNNTVYTISLENMNLCFLGATNVPALDSKIKEAIDDIDILFVPVGGNGTLDSADAYKLAVSLEPKIIIPMGWGDSLKSDSLKAFLKEGGIEKPAALDKLTIKKKDIALKEGEINLLDISN